MATTNNNDNAVKVLKSELAFVTQMYQDSKKVTDGLYERIGKIKKQIEDLKIERLKADYKALKEKHPYAILLFRRGDFYESYNEDAATIATILGVHLNIKIGAWECVTSFPHYAIDEYLPKLIRAGKRVAICDELDF